MIRLIGGSGLQHIHLQSESIPTQRLYHDLRVATKTDFHLDVIDVGSLDIESFVSVGQRLHEDLHSTAKAQHAQVSAYLLSGGASRLVAMLVFFSPSMFDWHRCPALSVDTQLGVSFLEAATAVRPHPESSP